MHRLKKQCKLLTNRLIKNHKHKNMSFRIVFTSGSTLCQERGGVCVRACVGSMHGDLLEGLGDWTQPSRSSGAVCCSVIDGTEMGRRSWVVLDWSKAGAWWQGQARVQIQTPGHGAQVFTGPPSSAAIFSPRVFFNRSAPRRSGFTSAMESWRAGVSVTPLKFCPVPLC